MISRIRRWWHLRRTAPDTADTTAVVTRLPRPAGNETRRTDATRTLLGADEQHVRAVLLAALGEHPAPGGDKR
ncbi:hypothetical protein VM98_26625 [Streptomyces rubellomurinus subsp. indigoferus]|nr:hypothetical protein VM98_26625 [Streptomyces rubellomurinus subsp. indigoferus]